MKNFDINNRKIYDSLNLKNNVKRLKVNKKILVVGEMMRESGL